MKRMFNVALLAMVFVSLSIQAKTHYKMHVGSIEVVPYSKVKRVVIGKAGIVSAKVLDDNRLLLIAEEPGNTEIQIWDETNRSSKIFVSVDLEDMSELMSNVNSLVKDLPGVKPRRIGGLIVLEGEVTKETLERANKLSSLIANMTSMLKASSLGLEKMVRMDVQIVEMRNNVLNNVGVKWDSVAGGPAFGAVSNWVDNDLFAVYSQSDIGDKIVESIGDVAIGSTSYASLGIVTGLSSQIQLLSEQGDARTLAQPTLSTRSGDKAKFLAGGEVPLPVTNSNGSVDVEYKEYGISLEIEPNADDEGNIVSYIRTEVSSIDVSVQIGGFPGFQTRSTESVVNVKNGDTIIISGLVSSEMSKAVSKVPFLGDIPILGELFKSRDFKDKKSELVILVTPQIVTVDHNSHQNRLKRAKELIGKSESLEAFYILD